MYDPDIVEAHNLSSQSYLECQLSTKKTESLRRIMYQINSKTSIACFNQKFDGKECLSNILIVAVDSMKERKRICSNLKKNKINIETIIDGRMGGPQLEVYTCKSLDEWENTFVDNPSKDPCGARYICYISMVIGAFIANQIKRILKKEIYKKTILFNIDSLQLI